MHKAGKLQSNKRAFRSCLKRV